MTYLEKAEEYADSWFENDESIFMKYEDGDEMCDYDDD